MKGGQHSLLVCLFSIYIPVFIDQMKNVCRSFEQCITALCNDLSRLLFGETNEKGIEICFQKERMIVEWQCNQPSLP